MSDRVSVHLEDHVADVRLARPEKLNALDAAMFQALVETGRKLAAEPQVRAVVLSGEGRAFCAGLDFTSFMGMAGGGAASGAPGRSLLHHDGSSPANYAQLAAWVWQELPVPVIAAIHGVAYGGGLQIALGADVRFVAPDAKLSVMEIKWGLVPDMSGTQTLRHLVRLDVAKELTFTGRIVSGTEAVALGLATRASDAPREAALDARPRDRHEIARCDPCLQAALERERHSQRRRGASPRGEPPDLAHRQARADRGREGEPREARPALR